jgi:hypothetical protein
MSNLVISDLSVFEELNSHELNELEGGAAATSGAAASSSLLSDEAFATSAATSGGNSASTIFSSGLMGGLESFAG